VVDQDFKTNTAVTSINVVEPFSLRLEIADVSDKYQKLSKPEGFGQNSYQ